MSTQGLTSTNNRQKIAVDYEKDQYSLWRILGIWASVALPMALLAWVIIPAVIPYSPRHPGITHIGC